MQRIGRSLRPGTGCGLSSATAGALPSRMASTPVAVRMMVVPEAEVAQAAGIGRLRADRAGSAGAVANCPPYLTVTTLQGA